MGNGHPSGNPHPPTHVAPRSHGRITSCLHTAAAPQSRCPAAAATSLPPPPHEGAGESGHTPYAGEQAAKSDCKPGRRPSRRTQRSRPPGAPTASLRRRRDFVAALGSGPSGGRGCWVPRSGRAPAWAGVRMQVAGRSASLACAGVAAGGW
jgi:hypothetical protein